LCLSGDHSRMGPPPFGRSDVIDIDSIQMLWILRRMRDEGKYLDGRKIKELPQSFWAPVASPFASEPRFQGAPRAQEGQRRGAVLPDHLVFDADGLETWLNELAKRTSWTRCTSWSA